MPSDAVGDAVDLWFSAESKRQTTGLAEPIAVQLEPARGASARQAALGDDNVGAGAGGNRIGPWRKIGRAEGEDVEAAPVPFDGKGAGVVIAA